MSMSKRDYQAIARALYGTRAAAIEQYNEDQWTMDRDAIAYVLAQGNPRFDRARFLEACETGTSRGMRKGTAEP